MHLLRLRLEQLAALWVVNWTSIFIVTSNLISYICTTRLKMSIHHKDILFPSQQAPSISNLLSDLRRTTITIHNRLTSIRSDAEFVINAARLLKRPLVANERCGSWYISPDKKDGSAYFKSTDGHERAWKFSTRRLNLHIAELADKNDGYVAALL